MNKNDVLTLQADALGADAQAVCRHEGQVVFVPGVLPGERISAQIVKTHKTHAFARLLEVLQESPHRVSPPCPYVPRCGGCACQHMDYETELAFKHQHVADVMARVGGLDVLVAPVIGMTDPWHYRNKSAMPVTMVNGKPRAGFYSPRSHRLVPIDACLIGKPQSDLAAGAVLSWMAGEGISPYDEETHTGVVRHIISRVNARGETMLVLAINAAALPHFDSLLGRVRAAVPKLVSLCISPNRERSNVILGQEYECLWGSERLEDELCGFTFELSPLSFFQVNSLQAETLYRTALSLAAPDMHDVVYDLYSGAGTISAVFAPHCREVLGIEVLPQAVLDARRNAEKNNLVNVSFLEGKAEDMMPRLVAAGKRPDIVVLDPPRKGAEESVLQAIVKAAPKRIVYISCHPATQARDAKILCSAGYIASACIPVDMFCHTPQVETVLLMTKAQS